MIFEKCINQFYFVWYFLWAASYAERTTKIIIIIRYPGPLLVNSVKIFVLQVIIYSKGAKRMTSHKEGRSSPMMIPLANLEWNGAESKRNVQRWLVLIPDDSFQ